MRILCHFCLRYGFLLLQVRKGHQHPFVRVLGLIFHGQSQDQDPSRESNTEYQQPLGQRLGAQSPGHCPGFNHQSTLSRIQWETISSWCDLPCEAASPSRAQEGSQQTELPSAASHLRTLLRKNPRGSVKPEEITACPEGRTIGVEDETTGLPASRLVVSGPGNLT